MQQMEMSLDPDPDELYEEIHPADLVDATVEMAPVQNSPSLRSEDESVDVPFTIATSSNNLSRGRFIESEHQSSMLGTNDEGTSDCHTTNPQPELLRQIPENCILPDDEFETEDNENEEDTSVENSINNVQADLGNQLRTLIELKSADEKEPLNSEDRISHDQNLSDHALPHLDSLDADPLPWYQILRHLLFARNISEIRNNGGCTKLLQLFQSDGMLGLSSDVVVEENRILYGSSNSFRRLQTVGASLMCKVIRSGELLLLPSGSICVGDIMIIEYGDELAADGLVLESADLIMDEIEIDGLRGQPKDSRLNIFVFAHTRVSSGWAKILVCLCGDLCLYDHLASKYMNDNHEKTIEREDQVEKIADTSASVQAQSLRETSGKRDEFDSIKKGSDLIDVSKTPTKKAIRTVIEQATCSSPFGSSDTDMEDPDNLDVPSLKLPNTVHSEIAEYARNESEILLRDVVPSAILDERLSARNHEIINLPVPLLSAPSDLPPWRRKDKNSSQSSTEQDRRHREIHDVTKGSNRQHTDTLDFSVEKQKASVQFAENVLEKEVNRPYKSSSTTAEIPETLTESTHISDDGVDFVDDRIAPVKNPERLQRILEGIETKRFAPVLIMSSRELFRSKLSCAVMFCGKELYSSAVEFRKNIERGEFCQLFLDLLYAQMYFNTRYPVKFLSPGIRVDESFNSTLCSEEIALHEFRSLIPLVSDSLPNSSEVHGAHEDVVENHIVQKRLTHDERQVFLLTIAKVFSNDSRKKSSKDKLMHHQRHGSFEYRTGEQRESSNNDLRGLSRSSEMLLDLENSKDDAIDRTFLKSMRRSRTPSPLLNRCLSPPIHAESHEHNDSSKIENIDNSFMIRAQSRQQQHHSRLALTEKAMEKVKAGKSVVDLIEKIPLAHEPSNSRKMSRGRQRSRSENRKYSDGLLGHTVSVEDRSRSTERISRSRSRSRERRTSSSKHQSDDDQDANQRMQLEGKDASYEEVKSRRDSSKRASRRRDYQTRRVSHRTRNCDSTENHHRDQNPVDFHSDGGQVASTNNVNPSIQVAKLDDKTNSNNRLISHPMSSNFDIGSSQGYYSSHLSAMNNGVASFGDPSSITDAAAGRNPSSSVHNRLRIRVKNGENISSSSDNDSASTQSEGSVENHCVLLPLEKNISILQGLTDIPLFHSEDMNVTVTNSVDFTYSGTLSRDDTLDNVLFSQTTNTLPDSGYLKIPLPLYDNPVAPLQSEETISSMKATAGTSAWNVLRGYYRDEGSRILAKCSKYIHPKTGKVLDLSKEYRSRLEHIVRDFESRGYFVLGFAYTEENRHDHSSKHRKKKDVIFQLFIGIERFFRDDAVEAIEASLYQGIHLYIVSNDSLPLTGFWARKSHILHDVMESQDGHRKTAPLSTSVALGSIYDVAKERSLPDVESLVRYRIFCGIPNRDFIRDLIETLKQTVFPQSWMRREDPLQIRAAKVQRLPTCVFYCGSTPDDVDCLRSATVGIALLPKASSLSLRAADVRIKENLAPWFLQIRSVSLSGQQGIKSLQIVIDTIQGRLRYSKHGEIFNDSPVSRPMPIKSLLARKGQKRAALQSRSENRSINSLQPSDGRSNSDNIQASVSIASDSMMNIDALPENERYRMMRSRGRAFMPPAKDPTRTKTSAVHASNGCCILL